MQTSQQIVTDIINSSSTHYTQQQIETEFRNEIEQFNQNEITEIELYEIISIAIDRNNI